MATAHLNRKDFLKYLGLGAAAVAARPTASAAERLSVPTSEASGASAKGSLKARVEPRAVVRRATLA